MNTRSFRIPPQVFALLPVNPHKIGATRVGTTILGDKVVYQADTK